jgi:hypothetical protein
MANFDHVSGEERVGADARIAASVLSSNLHVPKGDMFA